MSDKSIGIGFIGAGGIARTRHIPGLKALDGIKLVAVANRSIESGSKAAAEHGFAHVYTDWRQVVDDPEVDAVFICTQPYTHTEMTLYALSKGKHVFSQARMALDLEDARRMKAGDDQSSLTTMLCPPPHYMKVEPAVLQLLKDGAVGQVRHVSLSHATGIYIDPNTPLHWRQRADLQGINLLDVGIMAEVLQKWFGPVASLSAIGKTWTSSRPADTDGKTNVDLADSTTIIGELSSGATLTCLFSAGVKGSSPTITIHGSEGTLTCHANEAKLLLDKGRGAEEIVIPAERQGGWTVEKDFIDAIRENRKGYPSFVEGFRYMAFTQAVTDSMTSGGGRVTIRHD
jgi:predicted dehydrogenase